ncbi:BZ3500_MvSof-1268-A1-R1_Chr1-3g02225 [Microbotryum saponariae]|uniref:BZ3500_MvSof-1268-A1-R1_Chr1-3g02225 protein n=1 Tax=Microbotryum saponariae TaxID=289078 RepID=A0A2X0KBP8_9BASI|nr:BZ3500_MvSof-1268-A1-R1_Chr1-3g02225 [Microbotryum saponariae]SCZ95698.1 BZ3501_MvSof-1269-A2-R1_Chr1-3g01828 [Microbotryum saponariae]
MAHFADPTTTTSDPTGSSSCLWAHVSERAGTTGSFAGATSGTSGARTAAAPSALASNSNRSIGTSNTAAAATNPPASHPIPPNPTSPNFVISWSRESKLPLFPLPPASAFIAGAAAGAASRTVVSPLERLKIILQVQGTRGEYQGIIPSLAKMWKEEGFKGYMKGNGINCLRIMPYSAVQFSSYELVKGFLASNGSEIDTPRRLLAGSLAGIASVVSTYPLDLVRSRLSIESASLGLSSDSPRKSTGIWKMTVRVFREENGFKGLYRGLTPTAAGVAPYVAINFAAYESFKIYLSNAEGHPPGTVEKLCCGALAGSISQTLTYPLDVLRRRMQVVGVKGLGYEYSGAWNAVFTIIRKEGLKGLYKGIIPNLLKVGPSIGTSFAVYEATRDAIDHWRDPEPEDGHDEE